MKKPILCFALSFIFTLSLSAQQDTTKTSDDYFIKKADSLFYQTDEVVVTGTRIHKKIIDIPYSVVRINNMQYKYEKKVSIGDVLGFVPGVFLQSRYGNHDVRISIRGFGSRSNSGIRGVRILLDGIPESEPDGQTRIEAIDFNSVGSIEIVKGNSSSLYTNAPGGVVNFINDINFPHTFAINFNDFGEFGLRRNGIKAGIRTKNYGFLYTHTYHNYKGYRAHSEDFWHIVNSVFEVTPGDNTTFQVLGYFVTGLIRLPGSLTKTEFETDPFQAAMREVDFDFRRVSRKGRVGLRFDTKFGNQNNNEIEITTYGTIKYFERTQRTYRIINRYGLGATVKYVHRNELFGLKNEFSVGGDLLYQTGPIEEYININGKKGDTNLGLTDETIGNSGFYILNNIDLIKDKLSLLFSGRYDNVYFDQKDQLLEVNSDFRRFEAFTPKAAINFKITPSVAVYSSIGLSFDSPAGNELDNYPTTSDPGKLLNPDLQPQKSVNYEIGIKGNLINRDAVFFRNINFETTLFRSVIEDEIVPFEVFTNVYFRNSAKTNRNGIETGVSTEVIRGLRLNVSYTYSYFRYDEYDAVLIEVDGGQVKTNINDFSGNTVPSVPEHNLFTSLSFEQPLFNGMTGFAKVSYRNISGMYVDDRNSDKTKGYQLFNSTLGFEYTSGNFNVVLSGGLNNIFNKIHVGFININSTNGRFYEAGEPRNFFSSLNLSYNFR